MHMVSHALNHVLVKWWVGLVAASCRCELKEGANGPKYAVGVREQGAKARKISIQWGSKALKAAAQVLLKDMEDLWMHSCLQNMWYCIQCCR